MTIFSAMSDECQFSAMRKIRKRGKGIHLFRRGRAYCTVVFKLVRKSKKIN